MTNRTAAHRYARALFDVASAERANLEQIDAELTGFLSLYAQNPALERVLLNPAVPTPRKRAAVDEIARQSGLSSQVCHLLQLLADRDRFVILPELVAAYRQRLLDHQKVVRAEVTSAVPLEADRVRAIEGSFAKVTGRTVNLTTRVDPSLIGGLVARVGGTVYDASVSRQLERMKKTLEARG